jgi:hypothetical protein
MTKTQQKFYNMLKQQMVDFDEIFHKDFMIEKIEKVPDEKLKFLLEDINLDRDKIGKKGYITYAKFAHYAQKILENLVNTIALTKLSVVDQLIKKRDILLKTIEQNCSTLEKKNRLISDIASKKLMFKDKGTNILNSTDYYLIEKFGFYNFFDENRNYHIKQELENYFKEYISRITLLESGSKLLTKTKENF